MTIRFAILPVAAMAAALTVGCMHDKGADKGMAQDGSPSAMQKPLEGNPGATTNQSAGYPQSDPSVYHPQTDDTRQYKPATPDAVQPAAH